jgi:Na+-translocating ferredoxin:NAD+ oxidoreductase RnfD subunit
MSATLGGETQRRALGLRARNALLLAALLPGIALLAWRGDATLLPRLAIALASALCLESLCLRLRGQALRPFLLEGSAVLQAIVLVLWLPALEGWSLAACVCVALGIARQAFGGLGANLFHPAMAGVAAAQLLLSVPVATRHADPALAAVWLLGGAVTLALGISRWRAAFGLLAGAAAASLLLGQPLAGLADPRWALAAVFVTGDATCAGEQPGTRLLSGLGAGLFAGLAGPRALAALPFAILAINALVPALDARLAPRRRAGAPA